MSAREKKTSKKVTRSDSFDLPERKNNKQKLRIPTSAAKKTPVQVNEFNCEINLGSVSIALFQLQQLLVLFLGFSTFSLSWELRCVWFCGAAWQLSDHSPRKMNYTEQFIWFSTQSRVLCI